MYQHDWEIFDPQAILRTALSADLEAGAARKLELNAAGRTTFTTHLVREAGMRAALFVTMRSLAAGFTARFREHEAESANDPYMQGMRDGLLFASAACGALGTAVERLPSKWGQP